MRTSTQVSQATVDRALRSRSGRARSARPACFLCAALSVLSLPHAAAADTAAKVATLTYSGEQQTLDALDTELAAAARNPPQLAAIETRLLAALRRTDTTFAGRQAICQRLALVLAQGAPKANADGYKPLNTMLADERESDLARLALDPVPGEVVDGMYLTALGKLTGRARVPLINSLAARRTAAAVSALAPLANDPDAVVAAAAIRALGEIATAEAVAALRAAPKPDDPLIVAAKLAAARRMSATDAKVLAAELRRDARTPAQQLAALRLSLELDRTNAPARILEVLGGSDPAMKQAALAALAALDAADISPALAKKLPSFDPPTQVAVIGALAAKPDRAAIPALTAAAAHENQDVRQAAIRALGFMPGNREIALLLARIAGGDDSDDAKPARQSLARLNGRDVAPVILSGVERGTPAARAVFVEQLALRNMPEALPRLLKLRGDPDATVRTAAIGALGELGTAKELPAVLEWAMAANDDAEQSRALRAIVSVTQRLRDEATRAAPVFAAIEGATPEVCVRLIPVLSRLGGAPSAESAARLAIRNDEKVANAAVGALGRWTNATALPSLATIAEKAALPEVKKSAWQSALRYLERNREPWSPDSTELVARLIATAETSADRKKVAALLNRANNERAIAVAESLQSDPELADAAREAVAVIRANLAGPPLVRGSSNEPSLKFVADGKTSTRWAVPANGEEWLEVDFRLSRPMHRLTLDQTGRATEFPERYEVHVADDLTMLGPPLASGVGQRTRTVIDLPAGTRGRYVVIKNVAERKDVFWSVCELFVD